MEQYKFRGLDKNTDTWYYGWLYRNDNGVQLCDERYSVHPVSQDTIGLSSQSFDKENSELYVGDILQLGDGQLAQLCLGEHMTYNPENETIERSVGFYLQRNGYSCPLGDTRSTLRVGNVFEHPDMMIC